MLGYLFLNRRKIACRILSVLEFVEVLYEPDRKDFDLR